MVLRNANGCPRLAQVAVLLLCALVYSLVIVANASEASGQGESTYEEEYDDEGPYHREFEPPDASDEGLETFGDHQYDVLDPITDDDISYSGYDDEGLDVPSASRADEGNASLTLPVPYEAVSVPQNSVIGVVESVAPKNETTVSLVTGTGPTTDTGNLTTLDIGDGVQTTTEAVVDMTSCAGHRKLSEQPAFVSDSANFIRKCCPEGERLMIERSILVSCRKESSITASLAKPSAGLRDDGRNSSGLSAIVAQFYDGCIEDMEEDIRLGFSYGNPCSIERGLISFGKQTNDTLYVIQNGSLLVIYGAVEDYDVFDTYCLDYDRYDGSLVGYVCPAEVEIRMDMVTSQLFVLRLCLVFAIPLLLATAALYMIVPDLHDLHGRALSMNCVNFAIALLLESFFQHKTRGKRMNSDEMVLESYAEYFILATFFWLLVNCVNNCYHTWFLASQAKEVSARQKNIRFCAYAAVAQLLPLFIILSFATTADGNPAIKHYFFRTIMLVLVLTLGCLITCYNKLKSVKDVFFTKLFDRLRILTKGEDTWNEDDERMKISAKKINKVVYMNNYTTLLFGMMAIVWSIMTTTYYLTYELPIFFDILFGLQGILMFLIFVCMRQPFRTVQSWFQVNNYCGCSAESANDSSNFNGVPLMARGVPREPDYEAIRIKAELALMRNNLFRQIPEF